MADAVKVFASSRSSVDIDRELQQLPPSCLIAASGEQRLVVGPTGMYLVAPGGRDNAADAECLSRSARELRTALADHVWWVPFVDPLVVTAGGARRAADATLVPRDLLVELVIEGALIVDNATIERISDVLLTVGLPGWEVVRPARQSGDGSDLTVTKADGAGAIEVNDHLVIDDWQSEEWTRIDPGSVDGSWGMAFDNYSPHTDTGSANDSEATVATATDDHTDVTDRSGPGSAGAAVAPEPDDNARDSAPLVDSALDDAVLNDVTLDAAVLGDVTLDEPALDASVLSDAREGGDLPENHGAFDAEVGAGASVPSLPHLPR